MGLKAARCAVPISGLLALNPRPTPQQWAVMPRRTVCVQSRRPLAQAGIALRAAGLDLLIIDCPPGFSRSLANAIAVADLMLMPTGSTQLDLADAAATAAMRSARAWPYRFVFGRPVFRGGLAGQAVNVT